MKKLVLAKHFAGAAASMALGLLVLDCGNNSPGSIGGGTQGGGITLGGQSGSITVTIPDAGVGSGGGASGSGGPPPTADANCGVQTSNASKQPPDVLLVLDRSGSMTESIANDCCCDRNCSNSTGVSMCTDTTNCTQRWPALTSAVATTMSQTPDIDWGLKFFSTAGGGGRQTDACAVSSGVEVPVAATSASAINSAIASTTPGNSTPTAKAITAATAYLQTVNDQNNRVILLATDGEPNCQAGARDTSTPDITGTVAAIQAAAAAGFKVYVIGIGPSVGNLDNFAQAGGTNKYYPATSAADLASALAAISKAVSSCTFTMPSAPPDPNNLAVYVGGKLVNKDASNGWSFGSNSQTVVFNGTTCDTIKSGSAGNVQVLFGCPGSAPPPLL